LSGEKVRRPPKGWRRNMAVSGLLLLLLDAIIISPSPTSFRIDLALVVAVIVLLSIAMIWRRNTRLERVGPLA
jgi:Ca2+/Na+ antiporter